MFGLYPTSMIVKEFDEKTNVVVMETWSGISYTYEDKSGEYWLKGDICSCIMYDNETEEILDDVILKTRYTGWIDLD